MGSPGGIWVGEVQVLILTPVRNYLISAGNKEITVLLLLENPCLMQCTGHVLRLDWVF